MRFPYQLSKLNRDLGPIKYFTAHLQTATQIYASFPLNRILVLSIFMEINAFMILSSISTIPGSSALVVLDWSLHTIPRRISIPNLPQQGHNLSFGKSVRPSQITDQSFKTRPITGLIFGGHFLSGYLAATAACQLMHQNMGDRGFDGRNLDLLMKTWFGILAVQGGLAVGALFRNHLTNIFGGKDLFPFMARLTTCLFLGSDPT